MVQLKKLLMEKLEITLPIRLYTIKKTKEQKTNAVKNVNKEESSLTV